MINCEHVAQYDKKEGMKHEKEQSKKPLRGGMLSCGVCALDVARPNGRRAIDRAHGLRGGIRNAERVRA